MVISQAALGALYFYAFLLGGVLGVLYDCLRITRVFFGNHYSRRAARRLRQIKLPLLSPSKTREESRALGIVVFFEDLLFCLLAGISLILLLYGFNNGKFRFLVIFFAGIGFVIYRGTLGRLIMTLSEIIAFSVETGIRYFLFFLLLPLRFLKKQILRKSRELSERYVGRKQKKERARYTILQHKRARVNGCGMLPQKDLTSHSQRRLKKGRIYASTGRKKTVQPDTDPACVPGSDRGAACKACRSSG